MICPKMRNTCKLKPQTHPSLRNGPRREGVLLDFLQVTGALHPSRLVCGGVILGYGGGGVGSLGALPPKSCSHVPPAHPAEAGDLHS